MARFPWLTFGNGRPDLTQLRALRVFARTSLPAAWERNHLHPQPAVDWVPFNPISVLAAMFPLAVGQGKQFPIFLKKSLCTRCGACVRQCPTGRLRLAPYPKPSGPCVGCYGCINTCPVDAINTWFTNQQPRYRGPAIIASEV